MTYDRSCTSPRGVSRESPVLAGTRVPAPKFGAHAAPAAAGDDSQVPPRVSIGS